MSVFPLGAIFSNHAGYLLDKLKPTDFRTGVLFGLVDSLYRQNHGLTVTSNYSMRDLIKRERLHSAIVRRLDDMCRMGEV